MLVTVTAPWNQFYAGTNPNGTLDMMWFNVSPAPTPWTPGGSPSLCEYLASDRVQTFVQKTNLTCAGAPYNFGTYSLRASTCGGPCPPPFFPNCGFLCGRWVDVGGFHFVVTAQTMGCPRPKKWTCPGDSSCPSCNGSGGAGPAGGGPGISPELGGPGATLRYAASGPGGTGLPGATAWTPTLGLYWSHDYAERIVIDPVTGNDTHVWLITRFATFREFTGLSGGVYSTASPSDEYRKLHRTGSGWELHDLDGSIEYFDSNGLWTSTVDRNGNAKTASYTSGRLTTVTFPDQRSEDFTYAPSGKLATITENGVGGGSRTWTYTWSGDTLIRIDRPLGPAWEFTYGDARFPGYVTRMELVDGSGARRVVNAWEYDGSGNVIRTWKGDTSFSGANAVDKWSFSFDDPALPATTQVTDPLGAVATYTIGRDSVSDKPKVTSMSGDCPTCGLGQNSQLFYEDPANPLKMTRSIDGRGTTTVYSYDAHGQMTSKTEAFGTSYTRTTLWDYSTSFPAFVTSMDLPSTSGSGDRHTGFGYNATGDQISRTIAGVEAASAFAFTTNVTYNTAGQPLTIDPPGYGAADVTSFAYDPTRGNLLPLTRTDPLVGTTTFAFDAFNRRTEETDPNLVKVVTVYDDLNRVTSVTHEGATPTENLVTGYEYSSFGDLLRTTLPKANVVEYGYDGAGRLTSIERKPDASTHGERTFYTLDGAGNRTQIDLQHWSGSAWVTDSTTQYVFTTRCHPDKVVNADSTVTEYAYDCNGNLGKVWDANHPSANQTNPATQTYAYDPLNRMTSVTQPWGGAGGGSSVTSYTYDVQDHLASVTDAEGNPTTYTTSDRDLITEEVSNVSGTTTYAYNEHGQQVEETDARPVTVFRTYDALDRLTFIDYPDATLDTSYVYGTNPLQFNIGRLTSITRNAQAIAYTYDRFERLTQDGALTSTYDKNGNMSTLGYPNGVTATYTYDFADRQSTLTMQDGANPTQTLVSASSYKPEGPLVSLTLGNGLTETHGYNTRYLPTSISVPSLLSWSYTTDSVGNPTAITDTLIGGNNRTYGYQDFQYFLTKAIGPWGGSSNKPRFTYDKIGNRLTETNDPIGDTYSYLANGTGGNTARIDSINDGVGEPAIYSYDAVGNLLHNGVSSFSYGDDRRMSQAALTGPGSESAYIYDGRGFLSQAVFTFEASSNDTLPTYNSAGLLLHRHAHRGFASPASDSDLYVFYFAGRPVASLENLTQSATTTSTLQYLTVDHLGTPILMTDTAGSQVWQGGFEPFGADYYAGSIPSPTVLRLPGQWSDAPWDERQHTEQGLYYNVHRWYDTRTGRYTQPDPEWLESLDGSSSTPTHFFTYAESQPQTRIDPLGLLSFQLGRSCRRLPPDRLSRLQQAVADAQGNLGRVTACKQLVASGSTIIMRCGRSCGGSCGRYKPGFLIVRPSICVSPLAFGGSTPTGETCGTGDTCLASVVFHEMVHGCGGVHPSQPGRTNPYACEQKIYPRCVQQFPADTGQCPCTVQ